MRSIVREVAEKLTDIEVKILELLKDGKERTIEKISQELNEDYAKVGRGIMFLENKKLIESQWKEIEEISISEKGRKYLKEELPEEKLLKIVKEKKKVKISEIPLEKNEVGIAIGVLKKIGAILISKDEIILFDEKVELNRTERFRKLELTDDEIKEFLKRGLIEKKKKKTKVVKINEKGLKALKIAKELNLVDKLTRDIIISGKWKEVKFRRYDVESPVPAIKGGRKHPFIKLLDEVIDIFVSMGFKEMPFSPWVEVLLYDFDALVVPQDHPAREMQDTFYVKGTADLKEKEILEKTKKVHERIFGFFSEEESKKLVMRTHTTAVSVRTMMRFKRGKWFYIGRVFRNETISWKRYTEFHQVEGIIVEPDVDLGVLIGTLEEFYKKLGFKKVKVKPAYFPYTEPSLEILVYYNGKWLELGGAGIFREEINEIFEIDYPIAAWGLGLERLLMVRYGIKDIRDVWPKTRISNILRW